jgi:hypothetical protein
MSDSITSLFRKSIHSQTETADTRMITDVIAVNYEQPEFSWGAGANLVAEGRARAAYLAALRALDANENDVKPLLELARS